MSTREISIRPRPHPRLLHGPILAAALLCGLWGAAGCATPASAEGAAAPESAPAPGAAAPDEAHAYRHHGHGPHRFDDPEAWAKRFEDPSRDAWQKPDDVLDRLGLEPSFRVADIGSATGYFSVRIASRVPNGRVWGVDIEPAMVRYLNDRARREGKDNLFSILGTPEDPLIPEPVHVVLVVNTYHHIEARPAYFRNLASRLEPGGRIVLIDFKQGKLPVGPPESMKIPGEQVDAEMAEAGYERVEADTALLPYQWIRIYQVRRGG